MLELTKLLKINRDTSEKKIPEELSKNRMNFQKNFKVTKPSLAKTWLKTKGISERAPGICEMIPEGAPMKILEETFGEIAGRIAGRIHRTT